MMGNIQKRIAMALIALYPLLIWYGMPGNILQMSLGEFLIIGYSLFIIESNCFRIRVLPATILPVIVYVCLICSYQHGFALSSFLPPGGWYFVTFIFGLVMAVLAFDKDYLVQAMRIVVWIAIPLLWIQVIAVWLTGKFEISMIPNITDYFIYGNCNHAEVMKINLHMGFPSSIFLEKSYLGQYLVAYLGMSWFNDENKDRLITWEIPVIVLSAFVSRSGVAAVGMAVIFAIKMSVLFKGSDIQKRIMMVIIFLPLSVGAFFMYQQTEIGSALIARNTELSTEGTSGYTRVTGGYVLIGQMNAKELCIGKADYTEEFQTEYINNGRGVFRVNGLQHIIIVTGFIGLLIWLAFYIHIFQSGNIMARVCLGVFLTLSLMDDIYLHGIMLLLTVPACAAWYDNHDDDDNDNETE